MHILLTQAIFIDVIIIFGQKTLYQNNKSLNFFTKYEYMVVEKEWFAAFKNNHNT